MGEAELDLHNKQLNIHSHFICYGNAATTELTRQIGDETATLWNEPGAVILIKGLPFRVVFKIKSFYIPRIEPIEIYQNADPRKNYFRIEEFAHGNISFVDGLKCNSGYFKLENLYKGSTTAAHEYGHTLGLDHPRESDIRGQGVPGIMYPRGTLVDSIFQYDPSKPAGLPGGTMHPMHRKVTKADIENLKLAALSFHQGKAVIGEFTNIWHPDHADISAEDFRKPPIFG